MDDTQTPFTVLESFAWVSAMPATKFERDCFKGKPPFSTQALRSQVEKPRCHVNLGQRADRQNPDDR